VEGTVDVEHGDEIALGGRSWSKIVTLDPGGTPTIVLTAPDGAARLFVQAWCYDSDCTDAKRDEVAELVAAQVRPAR